MVILNINWTIYIPHHRPSYSRALCILEVVLAGILILVSKDGKVTYEEVNISVIVSSDIKYNS